MNDDNFDEFTDESIEDMIDTDEFEVVDDGLNSDEEDKEYFSEVLSLTEFDGNLSPVRDSDFVIAEYTPIKPVEIDKAHQIQAKNFVNRITKFISDFDDQNLTNDHKKYLKHVAELQIEQLADLLSLVDINKQMLNNIVERVNVTQAEDYAIINSYNNLVNQHIKLQRELSVHYKAIPATIKKMRNDVIQEDRLNSPDYNENSEGVITEDFGESQFNNHKQLLRAIIERQKEKAIENRA